MLSSGCFKSLLNVKITKNINFNILYNTLNKKIKLHHNLNKSNNSLFAIPANQEFVYVHRLTPESININKLLLSNQEFSKPAPPGLKNQQQQQLNYAAQTFTPFQAVVTVSKTTANDLDAILFREFVFEHVNTALNDGFNDNIGRTNVTPVFELPTSDTWYKTYEALVDFFLGNVPKSSKIATFYSQLKSQIDLDVQFSENRCKKLLQPALGLYQENLPAHYNKLQHQQRVYFFTNLITRF